ncbi:hypothetical protein [Streptomyces omiyaensis]|uniref:hypothetical protein n=1 Tax=Streptomyces omiyaensis TaxID=68247 RepID=UPI0036F82083
MALSTFADVDEHTTMSPAELAGVSDEARRLLLPYRKSIAARLGRSIDTVDRSTSDLARRGFLVVAPQDGAAEDKDANVYHLTDREQWARRTLQRAEEKRRALEAGEQWPARPAGPYVPRVYRDPGFDFVKLDAPTVANGEKDPLCKAVYAAVASFVHGKQRTTGDRPPTHKELGAATGIKSRTTISKFLGEMTDDGLLLVTERYDTDNGGRMVSAYTLMDGKWWAVRALARMRDAMDAHDAENDLVSMEMNAAGGWPHQMDSITRRSLEVGQRVGVTAVGLVRVV